MEIVRLESICCKRIKNG